MSVAKNLKNIKQEIQNLNNFNDLSEFQNKLLNLNKEDYSYNNIMHYFIIILIICLFGVLYSEYHPISLLFFETSQLLCILHYAMIIIVAFLTFNIISRKEATSSINELILIKYKSIFNNLKESSKIQKYQNNYSEFNRGDKDQIISNVYQGEIKTDKSLFNYEIFNFSYVWEELRTKTSIVNGNVTTTTYIEDVTYYRNGIIFYIPFDHNLSIDNNSFISRNNQLKTSFNKFNEMFNVHTDNELKSYKILKPRVLTHFSDNLSYLKNANFEFSDIGLLIGFDDSLDLFETEIKEFNFLDKSKINSLNENNLKMFNLIHLLNEVKILINLTDNNFN